MNGSEAMLKPFAPAVDRSPKVAFAFMACLLSIAASAQPGWRALEFSFILEHNGEAVPAEELRHGREFNFEVAGKPAMRLQQRALQCGMGTVRMAG